MTFGWTGRILRLDLSTGGRETLRLPPETCAAEIGGRGLGGYFLAGHAGRGCDDPALPLVIAAGPLTGTDTPGAGLCHVCTRSPLTGAVGDGVVEGGFGPELKRAGWDAVVLTGKSPRPCGVEIADGVARLIDASGLDELDAAQAHARLVADDAGVRTLLTGPAARSGCLFACLVADGRLAVGRGGLGRAAALKNLRYLAVRGSGSVAVADPAGLARAREDILRLVNASPALMGRHGFANFGTGSLCDLTDARRMTPTDNFRSTRFAAAERVNAYAFRERFRPRGEGCEGCPVRCMQAAEDGRLLPGFTSMSHFTALIGNADVELARRAADLCVRLGLEPASAAAVLACRSEIRGESLDAGRVPELLENIGHGRGEGAELAQGSARYTASLGRPELSMSVKGLDLPAFDPRGAYGMALGYAVSTRGGCHLRACAYSHEILRKPVATDRFSFQGKARGVKIAEDANAAADSLMACKRLFLAAGLEEYARAHAAVTGVPATALDLLAAGERIDYRERLFNARNGFSSASDDLPPRFFAEPGSGVPELPVPPIPRGDFLAARAAYYRIRGLDEAGRPLRAKAAALGLAWPDDLDGRGGV